MSDKIEELFSDVYYPGSKRQRRAVAKPEPKERDEDAWDANPQYLLVDGVPTELFTIGALAKALGREVVTMRLWERTGRIPMAKHRAAPSRNGATGRRLYTRAQVEGLMRIANEEGILGKPRAKWTRGFTEKAVALWQRT